MKWFRSGNTLKRKTLFFSISLKRVSTLLENKFKANQVGETDLLAADDDFVRTFALDGHNIMVSYDGWLDSGQMTLVFSSDEKSEFKAALSSTIRILSLMSAPSVTLRT